MNVRNSWYHLLNLFATALAYGLCAVNTSAGVVVYSQPHDGGGSFYQSSWWDPDGSDYDQLTWDRFRLTNATAITEIRWRGTFDPSHFGMGGPVIDFTVAIYGDVANGLQPDVVHPPFVQYETGGNAGQTLAGTFGGVAMYDYAFTLPSPFQAAANSNYWVLIEAWQHGIPDWGLALGTGGNGTCFRRTAGIGDFRYYTAQGDVAFTLLGSEAPTYTITASASPPEGGTLQGTGAYPSNSTVSLTATANPGFGFVNWTESNHQVSASPNYNFIARSNRTLVANFTPAYAITTVAAPRYAGSTGGDGVYNSNATVTVTAAAVSGFRFVDWTWFGTLVSTSANYTFTADADLALMANFAPLPATAVFDFDTGTPPIFAHQGMPASQTASGQTAYFSALSGAWSIQRYIVGGFWAPASFSENFLYPNTRGSTLAIQFDRPLTNISLTFCTADLAAETDTPTLIRVTAYTNSTSTPMVGASSARGAWLSGSYPEGTVSFASATPFEVVTLDIPTGQGPLATSLFFVDNIIVQAASASVRTINISASPAAGGLVSGGGPYADAALVPLNAEPGPGYVFMNWTEEGNEVSSTAAFSFTALSDRNLVANFGPILDIQLTLTNTVAVSWTTNSAGYLLQSESNLDSASWSDVTDTPVVVGINKVVTASPLPGHGFFRLRHP